MDHAHQLKHFITPQNEITVFFLLVNEEKWKKVS